MDLPPMSKIYNSSYRNNKPAEVNLTTLNKIINPTYKLLFLVAFSEGSHKRYETT